MEAVGWSETLVYFCQTTWHHILEDNNLHSFIQFQVKGDSEWVLCMFSNKLNANLISGAQCMSLEKVGKDLFLWIADYQDELTRILWLAQTIADDSWIVSALAEGPLVWKFLSLLDEYLVQEQWLGVGVV
jgi:hypothetical protein